MIVVLDSNALLMPFQYNLNLDMEIERILGPAEIYVPSCVIGELNKLAKKRMEARAALQLAGKYRVVEVNERGDRGVMEAAKKLGAVVVTNDKEFMKILKKNGIKIIFMKQNHLVMEDD